MQQRVHPHTHPHLPPPSLQPPLQLSINFPFCLVAADIPNTAISDLASDLAPWKPSAPPPAYGVPYPHQSIGLTAWRCYCIQKGRVFRRCIGREGRTGQTGIFKKTGGDVVVGHVCVQPGPHLLYLYLYRVTTKTHLCPRWGAPVRGCPAGSERGRGQSPQIFLSGAERPSPERAPDAQRYCEMWRWNPNMLAQALWTSFGTKMLKKKK